MSTVFFSWQSDKSTKEGRNVIERALEIAIARITEDLKVEEAERDELSVDKASALSRNDPSWLI
jgi:hypothetical protein